VQRQLLDRLAQRQRDNRTVEATIVIAPAPVVGHPLLENILQPVATWIWNITIPLIFDEHRKGAEQWDREAWVFNPANYQELLRALARFEKVVLLSGDVHYGFAARVEYWNDRTGEEGRAAFVQLTASGLRNEILKTRLLGRGKIDRVPVLRLGGLVEPWGGSFAGWTGSAPQLTAFDPQSGASFPVPIPEVPAVREVPLPATRAFARDPAWRYRIKFENDQRSITARNQFPAGWPTVPPTPALDQTKELFDLGQEHVRRHKYDEMRVIVGHNNLGDVRFAGAPGARSVKQALWFRPNPAEEEISEFPIWPVTMHQVSLEPPTAAAAKPDARQP
jgi:hypothetical protein